MRQSDRAGLLNALAGFCLLSLGDVIVKGLPGAWAPTAMGATRYVLASLGLSTLLVVRHGWHALWPMPRAGWQWLRGMAVAVSVCAMFVAVWLMPMAEAVTISFMQPMFTTMLASVFLGERLKPAALAATLLAFAGVVIVLRPNLLEIGPAALLPLAAAFAMAVLMIGNRATAGAAGPLAMQVYIANTASVLLLLATLGGHLSGAERFVLHWPQWHVVAWCGFIAVSASLAHWLIFMGTMRAGAATIAPMTYGQLLTAVTLAWLVYDEVPDGTALLGAAIIVCAGLWLWQQGKARVPGRV